MLCTNVNADAGCYFNSICISLTMLEQHILEYTNIYKWSPIPKRKDRRLKFTRSPVLLVDHCENFELLFSQAL